MRAEGRSWVEIADLLRERYDVNARVAMRWAHGWTQADVAREWCARWPEDPKTAQNISNWERWLPPPDRVKRQVGHEPSLTVLGRLAKIFECDLADLVADLHHHRHLDSVHLRDSAAGGFGFAVAGVSLESKPASNEATFRRDFTKTALLATLGLTEPMRQLIEPSRRSSRLPTIGREHVTMVEAAIKNIESEDAAAGAGALRPAVADLHGLVQDWLNGPYALQRVEGELQSLLGELSAWAGWLALDAEDHGEADRYLGDALVQARLANDPRLEVRALSYMCLAVRDLRPRESLQCAEAALQLARGWATPRLVALLHLRAARAHAALSEARSYEREMANAHRHLAHGEHVDDPLYIHFVTPLEADGIAGLSELALRRPDRAEAKFENIVQHPDPVYRRNTGYYQVLQAKAAAEQHEIDRASSIGIAAIPLVATLRSQRTRRLLDDLRVTIEPHRATTGPAGDFADVYAAAFAA